MKNMIITSMVIASAFLNAPAMHANPVAIAGTAKNLHVQDTSTSVVVISADSFVVANAFDSKVISINSPITANITLSGAGGLDTGSEAASTWYYIWVIYNPTTLTSAGLLSTSATAPTLPSGYSYQGLAATVYNDSSSAFQPFTQTGKFVAVPQVQFATNLVVAASSLLTHVPAGSVTAFRTGVPPIATKLSVLGTRTDTDTSNAILRISPLGASTNTERLMSSHVAWYGSLTAGTFSSTFNVPIWDYSGSSFGFSGSNTSATWNFYVHSHPIAG